MNRLIEANREELDRLRELASAIPTLDYSCERVQTDRRIDRIATVAAAVTDLEQTVARDIARYAKLDAEIRRAINAVSDSRLCLLLHERYLSFKKWEDIAVSMNYSVRQVLRLHGRALMAVSENMS